LRIAEAIFVQAKQVQPQPVLDFAFTEIMQARLPMPVLAQVLRHVRRQKNVTGVAAIHHALRNVDSRTGYVRFLINIRDSVDGTAVNSHPQPDAWMILQCSANLECAPGGFLRTAEKGERHPITGRHPSEFAASFCCPKTFGAADDPVQLLEQLNLLIDQQLRIAHYVD
jgi:hypothetical protein